MNIKLTTPDEPKEVVNQAASHSRQEIEEIHLRLLHWSIHFSWHKKGKRHTLLRC